MSRADLVALLPLIMLAAAAVIVMLAAAFFRRHRLVAGLTLGGLALSFLALETAVMVAPRSVTSLLTLDRFAYFCQGLVLAAGFVTEALAFAYLGKRQGKQEEFHVLLLLAILGAATLVASSHFASFFLGLELLSVSLFALIAYPPALERPLEAGIKYLIMSGFSSALLLFGMALVYAGLGTMAFSRIGPLLDAGARISDTYTLAGLALVVVGAGFKLSLVPFHMWAPDIYEGAPAPVAALVATVSKGAVFVVLLRYFFEAGGYRHESVLFALGLISVASMLAGNLLALLQRNIKRLLAYSSIAHLGYLLLALLAGGSLGREAATYYLAAYFVTMLGAFAVVSVLSQPGAERDADTLDDYRGLFWRRPYLAGIFTAMLLSLAGVPITMGFVGKFYLVAAGVRGALWMPVIALAAGSVIGLFYYLRLVIAMYAIPAAGAREGSLAFTPLSLPEHVCLGALMGLLIGLGVYPAPLIRMIQATVIS